MKKKGLMIVALALSAMLLTGCALPSFLNRMTQSLNREAAKSTATREPLPILEAEPAEYEMDDAMESGLVANIAMPAMGYAMPPEFNTEEYAAVTENGFKKVATDPLSTFSADVDTASYCNLRRMLNDDYAPDDIPTGAVRVEEMLNYFRYDYAAPEGDARFGVTARMASCPWNPAHVLLTLGVRAADAPKASEEGSNLVFLVDVSGSMSDDNKLDLAKRALSMLVDELGEKDSVSIVTYASGEEILIEGASPAKDKARLLGAIDALSAGGSTNGQRGLAQAYEVAQRYLRPKGNNRVIMCSDGDLNVGITSESDLHDFVTEKKETGIYLSVLGFGNGNYKDTKMETLADDGNGNYYYIDSILEARKVLCEELTQTLYAVADDVKFQVEFNPAKVSEWRQIGYENRALENQDFEDDKKDAGEVGSGACVTVMYELVPASDGTSEGGLKYQSSSLTEAAQSGEWLTLSTRYKEPGGQTSQLQTDVIDDTAMSDAPSGDFLFASAVAEFGMILSNSEYKGNASYDTVLDLLKQAPLNDAYREEFFSLVKIAQRNAVLAE
ncbi:MAG: VWA domain-containing protein [Clostridia bacterium]|nr:VWA domain-containing protein [Clostridia bacterium]MBQ6326712.1 VWA domain-containing protein [Clostridia bacterium]